MTWRSLGESNPCFRRERARWARGGGSTTRKQERDKTRRQLARRLEPPSAALCE